VSSNVPMTLEEQNGLIQSSFAYAKAITNADPVKVEAERQAAIKERSVPRCPRRNCSNESRYAPRTAHQVAVPPLRGPFGGVAQWTEHRQLGRIECALCAGSNPAPTNSDPGTGRNSSRPLSRVFSSCRRLSPLQAPKHGSDGLGVGRPGVRGAYRIVARASVNLNVRRVVNLATTIVSSFLTALVGLGICQAEIARHLGCSASLVSRLKSGERTLPLQDFSGLLHRLYRVYPDQRVALALAAVGPLLEGSGLRLVAGDLPPAPAAGGVVVDLAAYRQRMAA
jgi:hypothetical protein